MEILPSNKRQTRFKKYGDVFWNCLHFFGLLMPVSFSVMLYFPQEFFSMSRNTISYSIGMSFHYLKEVVCISLAHVQCLLEIWKIFELRRCVTAILDYKRCKIWHFYRLQRQTFLVWEEMVGKCVLGVASVFIHTGGTSLWLSVELNSVIAKKAGVLHLLDGTSMTTTP